MKIKNYEITISYELEEILKKASSILIFLILAALLGFLADELIFHIEASSGVETWLKWLFLLAVGMIAQFILTAAIWLLLFLYENISIGKNP